ncbi:MAG: hypothetical protein P0116_07015 [Candidatus Nitrosocosmicus sp.]|nr:hypothetical protein [Candidatus Nitrosocosmicus sp.]
MNWSGFKKELLSKNDKEAFNTIFENAKLYTQYLSNANRPVPLEPIMMGALFHNYKILLKLNNESRLSKDLILKRVSELESEKPLAKTLFDKTCERWRGLLYALHEDDREYLLRMIVDCCTSLDDDVAKMIINKVLESNISILFFFLSCLAEPKTDREN